MTPTQYARAADAFHKHHKALVGQLSLIGLNAAAAKIGKALPDVPDFKEVVAKQQALLVAMLELSEQVLEQS